MLYCIAAAYTCKKKMSALQRSDPDFYTDFVNLIRVSDFKTRIDFPIALSDITELEKINRTGSNPIPFRINVFREDSISGKIHLIRSSPLDDGKNINVLLIDFEGGEFDHNLKELLYIAQQIYPIYKK